MEFNAMGFIDMLEYMGVGMLGVFLIVGIIMASTYAIGSLTGKISKKDDSTEE